MITRRHCDAWGLAAVLLLLSACATSGAHRTPSGIAALRERAAQAPRDRDAQRTLALAEMFAYEGDPKRVDAQLERALSLDAASARLWLAAGLHHDAHGRPEAALDAYLRALTVAIEVGPARDPLAPQLAELSAHAIAGVDGAVTGYATRVREEIAPLINDPRVPMPARSELGDLLMRLHYRRGDRAAAQAVATQLGCVTSLRAAGPFGPRDLLGFDREHGVAPGTPLAAEHDLGPDRGIRPTRELGARGCTVPLGGGPIAQGGTTYAQGTVTVARAGKHLLRIESPNSVDMFIDGRSVLRIDRRVRTAADTLYLPLELQAGAHELFVKVTTRHPNPVLSVAVAPANASDDVAIALPLSAQHRSGFARYLRAAIALGRGDTVEARTNLLGVEHATSAAPLLLLQRSSVMLSDPLMPDQRAQDDARRLLEQALERDAGLWNAIAQLALMAANNGRTKEAITVLRDAAARFPKVPALHLSLANLLQAEGWDAEAERVIATARALVPDACGPRAAELDALRARDREDAAAELTEALMACEAQGNARYGLLLRQRRFEEAERELLRLAALDPPQSKFGWLIAGLELAKNQQDEAKIEAQLSELRRLFPQSTSALVDEIDRLAAGGQPQAALAALDAALAKEPAAFAGTRRLAPIVGGEAVLSRYRRDGLAAIAAFEKSGRSYDAPQVLVFDYMASEIMADGSAVELVHTVQRAQSDEAVNELAEVSVPSGARLLTLRVIKPDGRMLEADAIAGKDTISLPSMARGDYVETEMLLHRDPPGAFPTGYAGERFYFQSYEIPFDHSEMVVVLPEAMPYAVDPRGPAPKVEQSVAGGKRVLRFFVEGSPALQPEPGAVSAREFLPSVRVGSEAGWPAFVESIREVLVDRDAHDPEIAADVQALVGDLPPSDYRGRAKRLYDWVLAEVENDNDLLSQAAVMLRSGSGNRARVLHYLLKLAGVPAQLALVRSAAADATDTAMADDDTYEHLLVTFKGGQEQVWLFTAERWAPMGFVPPQLAGQPARLLDAQATVTRLPARAGELDGRRVEIDVTLRKDGSAAITFVETARGANAVSWRNQLESVPAAQLEHRFEEEYAARIVPGAQLGSLAITGRELDAEALQIKLEMEASHFGRRVEGGIALPTLLPSHLSGSYARVAARTTTQLIASPAYSEVIVRVRAPAGATLPKAPAASSLVAKLPGKPSFDFKAATTQGALVLERKIVIPVMRIAPSDYAGFSEFCRAVDTAEGQELVVRMP